MNFYWGAAASFAVFAVMGMLAGKFFHFEGPAWYFLTGALGALGIGVYSIFAYFQKKFMDRKEGKSASQLAAAAGLPAGSCRATRATPPKPISGFARPTRGWHNREAGRASPICR